MLMKSELTETKAEVKMVGEACQLERACAASPAIWWGRLTVSTTPSVPKNATASSMPRLRISGIVEESIVDGPGLRFMWSSPRAVPIIARAVTIRRPMISTVENSGTRTTSCASSWENPLLAGMTFSGVEPFVQAGPLCHLADAVHAAAARTSMPTAAIPARSSTALPGRSRPWGSCWTRWTCWWTALCGGPARSGAGLSRQLQPAYVLDRAAIEALRPVEA